jgi:WS/DGAT/MGAT family acyltransferase
VERLTTLDAGFLHAEDGDRHVSSAIGGLAVLEGPVPDHDLLMSTFADRIGACPRFAQRVRSHRFDLGAPQWVDHPGFDLAHHVRRIGLPQPGDDHALFRVVADVMAMRLDRDRPLWEVWVIEGLNDNRWAMLTKIHHCMADGIAATHMLAGLCDEGIGDSFASHIRGATATNTPLLEQGGFSVNPLRAATGLWTVSATVARSAVRAATGAAELAVGLLRPTSSTLNGPVTSLRRYSTARVPLDDVAKVCRRFGVTINDVALAAITESYRALLIRRGERPLEDALRTLVPVSTRSADAVHSTDNRVSVMLPRLPVEEENPVKRLRAVHSRLDRTKSHGQRQAGHAFVSAANLIPFPLTAWAVRLLARLPQRGVVTLATNVPGPRHSLHIMGRRVLSVFPIPPIAMHLRTGVAMLSYADDLFFGILADYETVPDADELARGIEVAVARLAASSTSSKRPDAAHRRGLYLVDSS